MKSFLRRNRLVIVLGLCCLTLSGAAVATHQYLVDQAIERGKERAIRDSALGICLPDDYDSSQAMQFVAEQSSIDVSKND